MKINENALHYAIIPLQFVSKTSIMINGIQF